MYVYVFEMVAKIGDNNQNVKKTENLHGHSRARFVRGKFKGLLLPSTVLTCRRRKYLCVNC